MQELTSDVFARESTAIREAVRRAAAEQEARRVVHLPEQGYAVLTSSEWKHAQQHSDAMISRGRVYPCGALESHGTDVAS